MPLEYMNSISIMFIITIASIILLPAIARVIEHK